MTQEELRTQFTAWVKNTSSCNTEELHELVRVCLDDAIEQIGSNAANLTGSQTPELMKQVLDYWSGNVYVIIEKGVNYGLFKGVTLDVPAGLRTKALQDFHSLRNACYAGYYS